jgi:hypothetical protein
MERVGGTIFVKVDGVQLRAKGSWTYDLGAPTRKSVIGSDGVHGYSETPKAASLEGDITDSQNIDLYAFQNITNSTVTLSLANGKTVVFPQAFYAGDGTAQTEEGTAKMKFEAPYAKEIGVTS